MSGSSGSHGRRASSRPLSRPLALPAAVAAAAACAAAAPPAAHAGLPVGRIDASRAIADEPKISARLRMPGYRGRIGIERRGQSSQMFPKQSYALELRDAEGEDRTAPLLGMPADGDWVLYAPYNDKTLVRNVLAYETARWTGRYAARTRLVELRLDGGYHRVYVLMEKLELGDDRVQGVALFELTFRPGALEGAVVPDAGHAAADRLGGPGAPRPLAGARRCAGGRGPGRRARAVPAGSWRRRIGEPSAVDFALVNELFKNEDGFHASTYMALRGGKLHLGPVWDFDISTGNSDYGPSSRLGGWMLAKRDWAERLYRDTRFTRRMAER